MNLHNIRREYGLSRLGIYHNDPIKLFEVWLDKALTSETDPTAMIVSTCNNNNVSSRVVLLKETDDRNFVFYTNYESRKGEDLDVNPVCSLLFYWPTLQRQIRISGTSTKISTERSDKYFNERPYLSRVGACVSRQSQPLSSKMSLLLECAKYAVTKRVNRPDYWGGYSVEAFEIEFWQGRRNRLHDRILYTWTGEVFKRTRLYP